jgi:hypothetical protein
LRSHSPSPQIPEKLRAPFSDLLAGQRRLDSRRECGHIHPQYFGHTSQDRTPRFTAVALDVLDRCSRNLGAYGQFFLAQTSLFSQGPDEIASCLILHRDPS